MKSSHVDSLLVVDKANFLLGLVTLKQIRKNPDKTKMLKDIMIKGILTVNNEDSIIDVLALIKKEDISFVPVIDENLKLSGLITKSSLLSILSNQFIDEDEERR